MEELDGTSGAAAELIRPERVSERIDRHRRSSVELTVTSGRGTPLRRERLVVCQTRQAFLFGSNMGYFAGEAAADPERWAKMVEASAALYNFATLPFYWKWFEPERGQPQTERLRRTAQELTARGHTLKGHPLCWHTLSADWLKPLSDSDVERAVLARIEREVSDFRGLIETWDVLNEGVIMPVYDRDDNAVTRWVRRVGRLAALRATFEAARSSNLQATLLINDFDLSAEYEALIDSMLEAGIELDAIGLQTHMHQGYRGAAALWDICERFARFGKPLHFTEVTLVSGELMPPDIVDLNDHQVAEWPTTAAGERRQTREAVELYRLLFSHPAVAAITWWDPVDGHWLNAPSGLWRADLSPKPAYCGLQELIRGDWWTGPTQLVSDDEGRVTLSGTHGDYEVRAPAGRARFSLDAAAEKLAVQLAAGSAG